MLSPLFDGFYKSNLLCGNIDAVQLAQKISLMDGPGDPHSIYTFWQCNFDVLCNLFFRNGGSSTESAMFVNWQVTFLNDDKSQMFFGKMLRDKFHKSW